MCQECVGDGIVVIVWDSNARTRLRPGFLKSTGDAMEPREWSRRKLRLASNR